MPCLCTYRLWNYYLLKPPASVRTLEGFLDWRPETTRFARLTQDGKHFVRAYGPVYTGSVLSSGPSAYLFDNKGRLVDWTYDCGDDPRLQARWSEWAGQGITRQDALHIVGLASGVRDLDVVLKGSPEATEALRGALEPDGLVTLRRSGQVYRLRVIELDYNTVFRVIEVEPDSDLRYRIRILNPWSKDDEDAELGEEMPQALRDLLLEQPVPEEND